VERIGAGREAEVFALDEQRVLRRFLDDRSAEPDARIMRHARGHDLPVPEVYDVDGRDLVMERIHGVDMVTDLTRRPWRLPVHARTMAELHRRLDSVPPLDGLPEPFGSAEALMHLNLAPINVMITGAGPVLIDWTTAANGPRHVDVAMTWLLLATGHLPASAAQRALAALGRRGLLAVYLRHIDGAVCEPALPQAARWRLDHKVLTERERVNVERYLSQRDRDRRR